MNLSDARNNMVEQQVRPWNVLDQNVLDVLSTLPRDTFVDPQYRQLAYSDVAIPLGDQQTMLPPNVEGRLLQELCLSREDNVLHIGTGSGYLSACLGKLAKRVLSVDINRRFTHLAQQRLSAHHIDNVVLETGDASQGWATDSVFDAVLITAAIASIPETYQRQLTLDGRLVAIVGNRHQPAMEAMLCTRKQKDQWLTTSLFETRTQCMQNIPESDRFIFD